MGWKDISVNEFIRLYEKTGGDFTKAGFESTFPFSSWAVRKEYLPSKVKKLSKFAVKIAKTRFVQELGPDKLYIWFKNNEPITGPTYDDIRFSWFDTVTNALVIGRRKGKWELWLGDIKHTGDLFHDSKELEFKRFNQLIKWLNSDESISLLRQ